MKLKLLMLFRDREYMNVLSECLVKTDNNMIIEIVKSGKIQVDVSDCCLITDLSKSDVNEMIPNTVKLPVICVTSDEEMISNANGINVIFKYQNINSIISEIKSTMGEHNKPSVKLSVYRNCKVIAVCCDGNNLRAFDVAYRISSQFIYRTGEKSAIFPLVSFISDAFSDNQGGNIRKLVYMLESGNDIPKEMLIHEESAGSGIVALPAGINPFNALSFDLMSETIEIIRSYGYRYVILLIGDCLNERNLSLLQIANEIFWIDERAGSHKGYELISSHMDDNADVTYMNIRNMETTLDVWIDNHIVRKYGG